METQDVSIKTMHVFYFDRLILSTYCAKNELQGGKGRSGDLFQDYCNNPSKRTGAGTEWFIK